MNRNSIALVKMWPTPSAEDHKTDGPKVLSRMFTAEMKTSNQRLRNFVAVKEGKTFPSPVASGKLNGGTRDFGMLRDLMDAGEITDAERRSMSAGNGGQLNPSWVCWLMGWPIGWTSLDPLNDILWLDWSVDPADSESTEQWAIPNASARSGRNPNTGSGEGLYYQVREKGATENPIIPRIARGIKDRVNRLKALGNGQVPLVAATAWHILTQNFFAPKRTPDAPKTGKVADRADEKSIA